MAVCSKCNQEIKSGKIINFEDDQYHPECFLCKQCGEQLSGKEIHQHEGENYDKECYASSFASKCGKCGEVCMDADVEYTEYEGQTFHPECFACEVCEQPIMEEFGIKEDKRVCKDCL